MIDGSFPIRPIFFLDPMLVAVPKIINSFFDSTRDVDDGIPCFCVILNDRVVRHNLPHSFQKIENTQNYFSLLVALQLHVPRHVEVVSNFDHFYVVRTCYKAQYHTSIDNHQ